MSLLATMSDVFYFFYQKENGCVIALDDELLIFGICENIAIC